MTGGTSSFAVRRVIDRLPAAWTVKALTRGSGAVSAVGIGQRFPEGCIFFVMPTLSVPRHSLDLKDDSWAPRPVVSLELEAERGSLSGVAHRRNVDRPHGSLGQLTSKEFAESRQQRRTPEAA